MTKKSSKPRKLSESAKRKHAKIIEGLAQGKSIRQSAVEAGYSQAYADSGQITRSLTWQELLEKHLPDEKLSRVLDEGLNAVKYEQVKGKLVPVDDYSVRHKYAETSLKLKSKFPAEKQDVTHTFANDERSDEEIERVIAEAQRFFNKE